MLVIALDGPAGTGKSTVARALAARLGLPFLDTGAMYRAVTWAALRRGVALADGEGLGALAAGLQLMVGEGGISVDGEDVTAAIRTPEVTSAVSAVSAVPAVRAVLRNQQRAWAERSGGGVAEGRDIGTVVFPDAPLKVYLDAAPAVRAARRAAESGGDRSAILADIERRDRADSTRADSPLRPATDAVRIDTSDLTVDEVVATILTLVADRSGSLGGG